MTGATTSQSLWVTRSVRRVHVICFSVGEAAFWYRAMTKSPAERRMWLAALAWFAFDQASEDVAMAVRGDFEPCRCDVSGVDNLAIERNREEWQ
jgi:hypothetical protein